MEISCFIWGEQGQCSVEGPMDAPNAPHLRWLNALEGDPYFQFVICGLNKDFPQIFGVEDIDWALPKETWIANTLANGQDHRVLRRKTDDFDEPEDLLETAWEQALFLKAQLSFLDYSNIAELMKYVFLENPQGLSALERFFAYCLSFGSAAYPIHYDQKVERGCDLDAYEDLQQADSLFVSISHIVRNYGHGELAYGQICKNIRAQRLAARDCEVCYFSSYRDVFHHLLFEMIRRDCTVKVCPNCGKYFVPENRADTVYCSQKSPQDSTKSCREYKKYANFLHKTQTDEATKLYRQIYNARNNKWRRTKSEKLPNGDATLLKSVQAFITQANGWKDGVKKGDKTEGQYIEWLRAVKSGRV